MNKNDVVRIFVDVKRVGTIIYYGKIIKLDTATVTIEIHSASSSIDSNRFVFDIKRSDMKLNGRATPSLTPCWTVEINKDVVCPVCNDKGTFDFGRLCLCPNALEKAHG